MTGRVGGPTFPRPMPSTLTRERLVEGLDAARGKRVVIVGDAMLDVYLRGDVERISPEAPVPVVRVRERREALGGAANVAQNVAALAAVPRLVAAVGRAVYADRPSVAGRTLDEVIVYACAAVTLARLYEVNLEREIGDRLRTGNPALQLLKRVNCFLFGFAEAWGTVT